MTRRCVRGETGAIFEVDASMIDAPFERSEGYRTPSVVPPTTAIKRLPMEKPIPLPVQIVGVAIAFLYAFGIVIAALQSLR